MTRPGFPAANTASGTSELLLAAELRIERVEVLGARHHAHTKKLAAIVVAAERR